MSGPVFLEADSVTLHPVDRSDLPFVREAMNDPRVWRAALDATPTNDELAEEFFETTLTSETDVHCLVRAGDRRVGKVSLTASRYGPTATDRSRDAEVAYWIAPGDQGQGHAGEAVARLVRYAFEDRNLRRLTARAGAFNDASVGLLESLGFEREGRLREAAWYRGDHHDMLVYGLLREDWRADG